MCHFGKKSKEVCLTLLESISQAEKKLVSERPLNCFMEKTMSPTGLKDKEENSEYFLCHTGYPKQVGVTLIMQEEKEVRIVVKITLRHTVEVWVQISLPYTFPYASVSSSEKWVL